MRCSRIDTIATAISLAVWLAAMVWAVGQERHLAVTVAAPEKTAAPIASASQPTNPKTDALPAPTPFVLPKPPSTLTIYEGRRHGGRALTFPLQTNWDAVDAFCARKSLAAITRELALSPEYETFRDARFSATWTACPEFRRDFGRKGPRAR